MYTFAQKNDMGEAIHNFVMPFDVAIANTYFTKNALQWLRVAQDHLDIKNHQPAKIVKSSKLNISY